MSKRWNAVAVLVVLMAAVMLAAAPAAAEGVAATATPTVRRVVVSIPDRKLAVIEDGTTVEVYDVAVGKPSTPSPVGTFTIVNRVAHPTYYRPGVVIGPGDRNPLGTRWMGLSAPYVGIHGTPDAASIGYSASHGCIRMRIPDAEWLFQHVDVGTPVFIVAK